MEYIIGYEESKEEENLENNLDNNLDVMDTNNGVVVDEGVHVFGKQFHLP
jgi:hypothetical protein